MIILKLKVVFYYSEKIYTTVLQLKKNEIYLRYTRYKVGDINAYYIN